MSTVLLCITAGRGPAECRLAVHHAHRVLLAEAESCGLSHSAEACAEDAASALVSLEGEGAEKLAKRWVGTIQWRAQGALRETHRRQNWFIGVKRLTPQNKLPVIRESDLRFERMRAGGPGGQHQNTTESAVRVVHVPTGLSAVARGERSQHRNKAAAVTRLAEVLAEIETRARDQQAFRDWLSRIEVERGAAVRVFVGENFEEA
jgi:peptide chain release factor